MDNQTITTTEFVFRRLQDPIKVPGWPELSGWLWLPLLGVVLFLGLVYIIWMYSRDAHSIGWLPATLLGMLRATVYAILAWVFLLPAFQTWEETRNHSRVVLAFDASQSVAFTRYDVPPDGVSPDRMPTRQDKIINFLTDPQAGFLSGLTAKNPVMTYRFGRLTDDAFHVFTQEGHWTRAEWEERHRPKPPAKEGEPPPPPVPPSPFALEQFQTWLKPDPKAVAPNDLDEDQTKAFQQRQEFLQKLFTGTNMGESLLSVVNKEAPNLLQGVVVFGDGHNTEGSLAKLKELAERCDKADIPLFIVGVGEDRQPIKIDIADVIAPPQARPEDEFRVTVEVIGEGLANEELRELYLDVYKPGEYNPKDKNSTPTKTLTPKSPVKFAPGEIPRGKAEFDIKPAIFAAADPDPKKKPEFAEGTWTLVARVPKDKREIFLKPEHLSDPVEIRVVKRPLRVLLFASAAMKDYQFVRTLLSREAKEGGCELCINLQPPPGMEQPRKGIVQDVAPEKLLTRFPDLLQEEDKVQGDDKYYNLSAYDVIIAFDPDWSRLTADQLGKLEQWVDKQGGGLMVIAAPVNTLQLYRAILDDKDREKEKYKPI